MADKDWRQKAKDWNQKTDDEWDAQPEEDKKKAQWVLWGIVVVVLSLVFTLFGIDPLGWLF